jgi:hypothetical protein
MFSFLCHCQNFYRNWLYIWVTRRVSYKKQELHTLHEHLSSPGYVVGTVFRSSLRPAVCRRAHVLFTLFVFTHSGVQHILCCVFVCLSSLAYINLVSHNGIQPQTIDTLHHHSPSLISSNTIDYSAISAMQKYIFNSRSVTLSCKMNLRIDIKT